ncbi:MAG: efflux RND transporter periplasmic adaptor subunit [Anaerolineae bacterium]
MQLNRFFLPILLVLTITACGYAPVTAPRRFNPATEPTLVPTSEAVAKPIYTIEQGLVTERLTFEARVSPRFETTVLSPLSGTILDLDVSEGDFVAAGDRLARYDFSPLEAEIAALQKEIFEKQGLLDAEAAKLAADVERAQIELDIALLDLELAEQKALPEPTVDETKQIELLALKATLAQNDFDRLSATIDPDGVLTAEIAALDAEIAELQEKMLVRTIVAPSDGTVLALGMQAGGRISAEQSVAVIGNMGGADDVAIAAVLRSDDLERLADGMQASLIFASDPETSHPAQIVRLPYPYNIGGNDLGFDPEDKALRILPNDLSLLDQVLPGEKVEVTITVDQNETALWLPAKAIREFSGRTFIVVREGEREQRIDVELGLQGDGQVEILGAVDVGQQVIGQ